MVDCRTCALQQLTGMLPSITMHYPHPHALPLDAGHALPRQAWCRASGVELLAAQLPGRGARRGEECFTTAQVGPYTGRWSAELD